MIANDLNQEEGEEISFVPNVINAVSLCDNQCSEKTLSLWQLASVVIEEGEESYCKPCYNESLKAQGDEPLTTWQWLCGEKGASWKTWKMMGQEPYVRGMWEYFCQERASVKSFREDAEEERQAGIHCQWQLASQRVLGASLMLQ